MSCKYTFLLPAYKAVYFRKALLSIKNQSFKDFKVLVSDDCSPDNLQEIFISVVGDDNRFVFRRNNENIGSKSLVLHWNLLVNFCETEYLILASDDDVYDSYFLESVDDLINKYPNVDLVRTNVARINEDDEKTGEDDLCHEFESQVSFLYNLFCRRRLKCIANYVFKTSALKKNKGFVDFPLAWGSDDITVMILSKNGVANVSSPLFYFRLSKINISSQSGLEYVKRTIEARKLNLDFFDSFKKTVIVDDSLLEKQRWLDFSEFYNTEWCKSIYQGAVFLPWKEFYSCYIFLVKRNYIIGLFPKVAFVWLWIRAHYKHL